MNLSCAIVSNYHISQHHANGNLYHNERGDEERFSVVLILNSPGSMCSRYNQNCIASRRNRIGVNDE